MRRAPAHHPARGRYKVSELAAARTRTRTFLASPARPSLTPSWGCPASLSTALLQTAVQDRATERAPSPASGLLYRLPPVAGALSSSCPAGFLPGHSCHRAGCLPRGQGLASAAGSARADASPATTRTEPRPPNPAPPFPPVGTHWGQDPGRGPGPVASLVPGRAGAGRPREWVVAPGLPLHPRVQQRPLRPGREERPGCPPEAGLSPAAARASVLDLPRGLPHLRAPLGDQGA
ncbi:uncharacterized protein [Notamacropus eugenii]|uniref:uncharacterized protein n=1 Tax=Notamacropus eugenii TaxID=9315 RepID=UPI003B672718